MFRVRIVKDSDNIKLARLKKEEEKTILAVLRLLVRYFCDAFSVMKTLKNCHIFY